MKLSEFKMLLKDLLDNNRNEIDKGQRPIAIGVEGPHGIGKTQIVEQIAHENNMGFVKINLAELEDAADMVGFPVKEYLIQTSNGPQWIAADLIKTIDCGDNLGQSRMSYATPAWLPREENPNGVILFLDDYSRKI